MRNSKLDIHEKCGVIGIYTADSNAAYYARSGLATLQHRGLESAGMSVIGAKNKILTYKNMGLIPHVLNDKVVKKFGKSKFAIGQNRYGTFGQSSLNNAQPIHLKNGKFEISIGHNGNIPDVSNVIKLLKNKKQQDSDTNIVAEFLIQERPKYKTWIDTIKKCMPLFNGAYNLVIVTNDNELFGIRDPYGIRPFCLGKLHDGWVMASESVALDILKAEYLRDIIPGEIIRIDDEGTINSQFFGTVKKPQPCIFEGIYFSRPDSFANGKRVKAGREKSGKFLGTRIRNKGIKADIVIPIFDSGYPAAKGVAKELDIPIVDAITTSHYVGRTFIRPGQENRIAAVSGKHNVVADEIRGKKVIVVDDSAVRLTTSTILARDIRDAGAEKIYMAFASPPVVNQCDLGIDMRTKQELAASAFENEPIEIIEKEMAKKVKADEVIYLPIEETALAMGGKKEDFYHYIFGGPHPVRDEQFVFKKMHKKINSKPKISIFVSGSGTNLQKIIDRIESNDINAKIISVLSNKEDAYATIRAKKHNIPISIIPYQGKLSDKKTRENYEEKLTAEVKNTNPDLIILSGWMLVLGYKFLKEMQNLEIPVINLHPSLMTKEFKETIRTSKGKIPVIRGAHAIREAYDQNLPVSGVTVHQVIPSENFDIGPIILKSEVARHKNDSFETWEKKIHETEYQVLPTAIKRVLHVISQNIDISKGDFVW